jgi:Saxitoxin biosynthesis operon protein SxtJ
MSNALFPGLSAGHAQPKMGSERNFGLVFAAVFALMGLAPLVHAGGVRLWPLPVAVAFLAVTAVRPGALAPLNRLWFRIGILLGKVMTPVMMGVLFFVVVTPVGLLMRLCGKDPLRLKREPAAKSYWLERSGLGLTAESLKDQF